MNKSFSVRRILLLSIVFVVILSFIAITRESFLYGNNADTQFPNKTSRLTIETKPISILYPHEHKIEDSVFNSDHHIRALSETVIIQEDLWITRFEAVLKNAPMAVLHHAGIILPDKKKRTCPNSIRGREIFAVTPDMAASPIEFEEPYGIFLPKGSSILLGVLFHNPLFLTFL